MISRRTFLRSTLVGGALIGAAGLLGSQLTGYALDPALARRLHALSPKEFLIMQAVARRVLAPDGTDAPTPEATETVLYIDWYLTRLPGPLGDDLRALLQLVEHASGPFRLRASRFTQMSPAAQDAALADWESSRLAVRRQGFQALRTLSFLGYWRDPRTWPLLGYPGPVLVR